MQKYGNDWPNNAVSILAYKAVQKLEFFHTRMIPDVTKTNSYIQIHASIFFPVLRFSAIIKFFSHQLRVENFSAMYKSDKQ